MTEVETDSQDDIKHLKRKLEGWREILLPINSVLLWEKPFYPGILAGATTLLFLLIWYLDLSVLTTLSIVGLLGSLLDYAIPLVSASLFDPNQWNGTQEKQFEEICQSMVESKKCSLDMWKSLGQLKESKPKVYFVSVLSALILSAWIGNVFDNLFLTYLLVTSLLLLPGLRQNGTFKKLFSQILSLVNEKVSKTKIN